MELVVSSPATEQIGLQSFNEIAGAFRLTSLKSINVTTIILFHQVVAVLVMKRY